MRVQKIQNNNYNLNFGAKFDMKPLKGMITGEEILKLQEKAKNTGNKDSLIKVVLKRPYIRTEYNNYTGRVYHCYDMHATTYHNGELDSTELGKSIPGALYDATGKLKEEFKPFNILNKWLDNVFKPKQKGEIKPQKQPVRVMATWPEENPNRPQCYPSAYKREMAEACSLAAYGVKYEDILASKGIYINGYKKGDAKTLEGIQRYLDAINGVYENKKINKRK